MSHDDGLRALRERLDADRRLVFVPDALETIAVGPDLARTCRQSAGLPPEADLEVLGSPRRTYWVRVVGTPTRLPSNPDAEAYPYLFALRQPDQQPLWIWLVILVPDGVGVRVDLRWHAQQQTDRATYAFGSGSPSSKEAAAALRVLKQYKLEQSRGKREGDGAYYDSNQNKEFVKDLHKALELVIERTGSTRHAYEADRVAKAMLISRSLLYKQVLAATGFRWRDAVRNYMVHGTTWTARRGRWCCVGRHPRRPRPMRAIYVPLTRPALEALGVLADREYRHPRDHAAKLLTEALRRTGALTDEEPSTELTPDTRIAASG